MACQVEMMNGNGTLNDRESSPENESDIEIMTLKQTLKEKLLNDNVNGGSVEAASSSNSSFNGIGTVENGHTNDKLNTDSEFENDSVVERQTPKRVKGKLIKGKKEKTASPKSKRRTPVKKVVHEEESTVSEQSWESIELARKDIEDDASTLDVGDNEVSAVVVEEGECSMQDDEDLDVLPESLYEESKDQAGPSVFSRLRDSMRFSISPQKQEPTTSGSSKAEKELNSFRSFNGRRALHQTPPRYSFKDELVAQKRKADSEDADEPRKKYFMTDRSPGWKLLSSPFHRFWSPKKSAVNTSVSSSTPLRKLHEDVRDDSMIVNVNDSLNISLEDEEMNVEHLEKIHDLDEKQAIDLTEKSAAHASWKCIIM